MRDIAALVFGGEPADPKDSLGPGKLFAPGNERICDGIDTPAAEWCKTPPGHGALNLLGVLLAARRATRTGSRR